MTPGEFTPEFFTADYEGTPGRRTFFIQVATQEGVQSYLIEKQQVAALADKLREMLLLIDKEDTVAGANPGRDPALKLREPVEPEWRIGTIGLAYEEEGDRVIVLVQEVGEAEPDQPDESDLDSARFLLRRDQVRAFVLHAMAVVDEGRPTCQLCGLPMEPEGHRCPASNGHHPAV